MAQRIDSAFFAPTGKRLQAIADGLMARPAPAVHTLQLKALPGRPARRIHYVARSRDVLALLRGPEGADLSCAHNDRAMQSATRSRHGALDFLLGDPEAKALRWAMLRAALDVPPTMRRRDGADFQPYARPAVREAFAFANAARLSGAGRFDAVGDYGRIAAALAASRFTGLSLPLPDKPLNARAERFALMNFAVFGQVFGNLDDRNPALRLVARLATGRLRRDIAHSARDPRDGSLLARLRAVRHAFPDVDDATFQRETTALVYEIAGTIQILVSTSFANMIEAATRSGQSVSDLAGAVQDDLYAVDEALRLVPTSPLLSRVVERPFTYGGVAFEPGDYVCAITSAAGRDPDAFPAPERFALPSDPDLPRRRDAYTNFGPNEAGGPEDRDPFNSDDHTHPCFGQYWARHLLRDMLVQLAALDGVRPIGDVTRMAGLPSRLPMTAPLDAAEVIALAQRDCGTQNLYTVLTPIRLKGAKTRDDAVTDLQALMKGLGNPADGTVETALRGTGIVHFASLTVVPGENREPSYVVLEFSADGPEDRAIDAVVAAIGDRLLTIYQRAGAVTRQDDLADHLKDHAVSLAQSPWPGFLSGRRRNGLGFCGTQGLSQPRILAEAELARVARETLQDAPAAETPLQAVARVREALQARTGEARSLLWPLVGSEPPIFAEDARSPWVSVAASEGGGFLKTAMTMAPKMFPRPLLPWLGLLALAVLAVVHSALGGPASPVCGSGCVYVPPWIFDPAPTETVTDWVISPGRLALAIGFALVVAVLMSAVGAGLRRAVAPVRSFGFSRMGGVLWFSIAFAAFAATASLGWVDRPDMAALALPPAAWIGIAVVTLSLMVYASVRRGQPWRGLPFALLGTAATVTLFALAAHLQLSLFTERLPRAVLNRWGDASLATLLLYPALLAGGLYLAGRGLAESWRELDNPRLRAAPVAVFTMMFAAVFVTSFFTLSEVTAWLGRWRSWGWQWVALPSLLGAGATIGLGWLNSTIAGRKAGRREWFALGAALSVAAAAGLNAGDWAGPEAARLLVAVLLAVPVFLIVVGAVVLLLGLAIRASETRNRPLAPEPQTDTVAAIMARENRSAVQNHMSSVVRLVPSPFRRRITLPLALRIVWEGLANGAYRPGFLGSLGTVQYARWIHLPGTNNYVFYSNYDGSFESYLEDFITKASFGMTGVWSHSVGFPATRFLFFDGSEDGDRFKRYARGSMIPTPFWFSAYPHLAGEQIRRNALIRDGLARVETASDASAWLDLFGSMSRPDRIIEEERVQSLLFSGNGKLRFGACLAVIPDADADTQTFRAWLCDARRDLTFGDHAPKTAARYLALGASGLRRLGMDSDVGSSAPWDGAREHDGRPARTHFPPAFALGMAHPSRGPVLGDTGADAPLPGDDAHSQPGWDWGAGEREAAAVLLLYADTRETLQGLVVDARTQLRELDPNGRSHLVRFKPLPAGEDAIMREPFGFADGISQPLIAGSYHARQAPKDSIHRVAPGEFILGYRDNRGFFPPSPEVESVRDPQGRLPSIASEQPLRYPRFADDPGERRRDLGRNGSFLVIRQLEQDVDGFWDVTERLAAKYCPAAPSMTATLALQAKMVGRWHNGQTLQDNPIRFTPRPEESPPVDHPTLDISYRFATATTQKPNNEFLFARDDSQGELCPLGSHVRRAFPRDGLDPDNPDSLSIANRHRLLRRGRTYVETGPDGSERTGTFFVCLNADIERQFELVQQTWIGSPKFHSLTDEVDPITAQGVNRRLVNAPETLANVTQGLPFTLQARGREVRLEGLRSFVRMRGGGYFFLPGRDALDWMCEDR